MREHDHGSLIRDWYRRAAHVTVVLCVLAVSGLLATFAYADETPTQNTTATTTANTAADAPEHSKRIEKNTDGTYTISMDVTGRSSEINTQHAIPLDIALVLDVSGSMDEPSSYTRIAARSVNENDTYYVRTSSGGYDEVRYNYWYGWVDQVTRSTVNPYWTQFYVGSGTSRLDALKASAESFIQQIGAHNTALEDKTGAIQVSIVKYAGDASNRSGNDTYDPPYGTSCGENGCNRSQIVQGLTTDTNTLKGNIANLRAGGATRSDYGLQAAKTALTGANGNRANVRRLVVFYSDGEPNKRSGFDSTVADSAIAASYTLKKTLGADVYAISTMPGANPTATDNADRYMNYVSSNYPDAQSLTNPGAGTYGGNYYHAVTSSTDLQRVFDSLVTTAVSGNSYQTVTMTDRLSQYARSAAPNGDFSDAALTVYDANGAQVTSQDAGLVDDNGNPTYTITRDASTQTVSVALGNNYVLRNGYRYVLSYRVTPTALAYDEYASGVNSGADPYRGITGDANTGSISEGVAGFRSNTEASISYVPRVDGEPGNAQTTPMPHPVIQVDADAAAYNRITVTKQWLGTTAHANSVSVDVACKLDNGSACTGYSNIAVTADGENGTAWQRTLLVPKSDQRRTFTITEHAIDGWYTAYDDHRSVVIDADASNTTNAMTVTNYPTTATMHVDGIRVGKTVVGGSADRDFTFTLAGADQAGSLQSGGPFSATINGPYSDGTQKTAAFTGTATVALPAPGAEATPAYFTVTENDPSSSAWTWDRDRVGVRADIATNNGLPVFEEDGSVRTTVSYTYDSSDSDGTDANRNLAAFTNQTVRVSQLPVTGGNAGRTWTIILGGLAGAALISGAATVLWKRREES